MKDTTRRIFEKENQAEVSNNIDKRANQKSFTQLVSLTLLNRQPKIEFKSIDIKQQPQQQNYLTQRNPNTRSEVKTTVSTTEQIFSPITVRQTTSISQCNQDNLNKEQKNPQNKLVYLYGDNILINYQAQDSIQKCEFLKSIQQAIIQEPRWLIGWLKLDFFMAVRLMDTFLHLTTKQHVPQDLHLVGVTCMFIASKFEEIYPLSKDEIKDKECQIAQALDFNFVGTTISEIITMTLQLINQYQKLHQLVIYLAKIVLYDYELISQYNYSSLSAACIIIGCNLLCQESSDEIISQTLQVLNVDKDETVELSNKVLNLAKNFDKLFPNLENLKKFNKNSTLDIIKLQK